jgi:hypothetical protein
VASAEVVELRMAIKRRFMTLLDDNLPSASSDKHHNVTSGKYRLDHPLLMLKRIKKRGGQNGSRSTRRSVVCYSLLRACFIVFVYCLPTLCKTVILLFQPLIAGPWSIEEKKKTFDKMY